MPNGGSPLISTDDGTLELVGMAKLSLSRDATNRYSPDVSAVGLGEGSDSGCIITEPPDGVILGTTESTPVRSAMVGGGSDPDPSVWVPTAALQAAAADAELVPAPLVRCCAGCESRNALTARALRRDDTLEPS